MLRLARGPRRVAAAIWRFVVASIASFCFLPAAEIVPWRSNGKLAWGVSAGFRQPPCPRGRKVSASVQWGSPRLPLIPEVLIIHHADDLDAKMEMYMRCLRTDKEHGPFTARDPVLGRPLYKGRSV